MNYIYCLAIVLLSAVAVSAQIYVSPSGRANANGTVSDPYTFQAACNLRNVAGQTILLRGGTYKGNFICHVSDVTIRSHPNELATVDSNYTSTLQRSISPGEQFITIADTRTQLAVSSAIVINDVEMVQIGDALGNGRYYINRGWGGTRPVAHSAGAVIAQKGNAIEIWGNNVTYRDLEILDSKTQRAYPNMKGYQGGSRGGAGISVLGDNVSIINMLVHDNGVGIFETESAESTLTYGNILFNNGHVASDRGHGQGLYVQNIMPGAKRFENNIVFNNYSAGAKAYGANQGHSDNVHFKNEVLFNNGSPSHYEGDPIADKPSNWRDGNLFIGSDVYPSKNVSVKNTYLYHPRDMVVETGGLPLGRAPSGFNVNAVIENIYIAEPWDSLVGVNRWQGFKFTGSTVVMNSTKPQATDRFVTLKGATEVTIDRNHYYTNLKGSCGGFFILGKPGGGNCGDFLSWSKWRAQGYDANSTYTETLPTTNSIFVLANQYEPGRASIVVYNWRKAPTVSVSLAESGLVQGQAFTIINVQNFFGKPVYEGTYLKGQNVSLTTQDLTVTTPIGATFTPASTCPEFCVYLVVPKP